MCGGRRDAHVPIIMSPLRGLTNRWNSHFPIIMSPLRGLANRWNSHFPIIMSLLQGMELRQYAPGDTVSPIQALNTSAKRTI